MHTVDILALAQEAASHCLPITVLSNVVLHPNENVFHLVEGVPSPEDGIVLAEKLHRHGFFEIDLPVSLTETILELEICCQALWSVDLAMKKKIGNIFKKSKSFTNRFSYSYLPSPGKESWKIRTINSNEKIMIPDLDYPTMLNLSYEISNQMHAICLSALNTVARSFDLHNSTYFSDVAEPCLHVNSDFHHGLSTLLLLRYFDESKPTPVECHTDQHIFTIIPLNTTSPALELYDFETKHWRNVEDQPGVKPFTRAVVFAGETLSRMTNDYFTSCLHKVVSPKGGYRFSVPYMVAAKKRLHAGYFDRAQF